ncbi:MAG TPA: glycosyltransferase family 4 protein [Flavobacterium sp.]|jgi:glycosyltransferase involved in cell wall biosynthesis
MKKVLIITYYWPPAGGPGVQRWLKFVKYLPENGILPIIYIPENPAYPIIDEDLQKEVPEDVIIIRKPILEPYGLASIFSKRKLSKMSSGIIPSEKKQTFLDKTALWIRGNLFIPDARILWVRPSVKFLREYLQQNNIDTVITTGPPHSLHLIGLRLKEQIQVKWIADFRDPWTTIGYHKKLRLSLSAEKKHQAMERAVLNAADRIIVTSKSTKAEFEKLTSQPVDIVTNGYDIEVNEKPASDSRFSVAHIGSFLSGRNPEILWQALSELLIEMPGFADKFELKLIGTTGGEIIDAIERYKLEEYTTNIGYVSHKEAVFHQRNSQVLLLVEIDSAETVSIIPGKLFEYMASGRPVVAIGPEGSDFADIISDTGIGIFANYREKEKVKNALKDYFINYIEGNLMSVPVGIEKFSRRNLTRQLSELLKN